jgi:hypothetical protein
VKRAEQPSPTGYVYESYYWFAHDEAQPGEYFFFIQPDKIAEKDSTEIINRSELKLYIFIFIDCLI